MTEGKLRTKIEGIVQVMLELSLRKQQINPTYLKVGAYCMLRRVYSSNQNGAERRFA